MARKKRVMRKEKIRTMPNDGDFRTTQIKLLRIAKKLGSSVEELIESYGDAKTVIDKFDSGALSLITED